MGLQSILQKKQIKERQYRILVVGLQNSGKTTILMQLCTEHVPNIVPTEGVNSKSVAYHETSINLFEVGGQNQKFWSNFFKNTDAIVYVIDSSDREHLEESHHALQEILGNQLVAGIPLLVFANKQDLSCASRADDISDVLELATIKDRSWKLQPCTAVQDDGLTDGLEWLLSNFVEDEIISP